MTEGHKPAFPSEKGGNTGMTLEQWYTGMALQGILAADMAKGIASDPLIIQEAGGIGEAADLALRVICNMAKEYARTTLEEGK